MYAGKVIDGEFVAFENDEPVTVEGAGNSAYRYITRVFNYADYTDTMSDGTKQLVIKLETTGSWQRLQSNTGADSYYVNNGILDMIQRRNEHVSAFGGGYLRRCRYFYNFGNRLPNNLSDVEYVKTGSGICISDGELYANRLKSFLGTVKQSDWSKNFWGCTCLQELTCDISDTTSWNNPFYASRPCSSLRKLLFTGGESLTSFPGNIDLSNTALGADAVLAFFNTLPDISTSTTRTITLKNTPAVVAGIPESTLAVATNKGWTVVTA